MECSTCQGRNGKSLAGPEFFRRLATLVLPANPPRWPLSRWRAKASFRLRASVPRERQAASVLHRKSSSPVPWYVPYREPAAIPAPAPGLLAGTVTIFAIIAGKDTVRDR